MHPPGMNSYTFRVLGWGFGFRVWGKALPGLGFKVWGFNFLVRVKLGSLIPGFYEFVLGQTLSSKT